MASAYQFHVVRLVREIGQLDAHSTWEKGHLRLLKPGSLHYFVQHSRHWPGIPIYVGLVFVFLIRNTAIMSYNESLGESYLHCSLAYVNK